MLEKEADFTVAGQVSSATEGLSVLASTGAGVVLLDVDPSGSEPDFVGGARAGGFEGKVLIATAGISDQEAANSCRRGFPEYCTSTIRRMYCVTGSGGSRAAKCVLSRD